ncbi:MAG: hypothetical protein HFI67_06920 [Lachnospiraceae bacterium]|nr:hypothetical protein [Lachnospiraceae bacterium]
MKRKKLVSMLTAGALAASMVLPAMAADGGTVDVDVTTKTGILRVEVPTTLAVAVDQFETTDTGSQIYSEEFTIANKSEVNVKVSVTSTATLGSDVMLAAKREDVATAAGAGGTAWLAVAASLDGTKYEASSDLGKLSEASANVTTFAKNGAAAAAAQTFYLKKGTANSAAYKLLVPSADGKNNDVSYAQFYKLTALATQPTDDATLQTAVNASDVYVVVTANAGNDGEAVTKLAKGSAVASSTFAGTNTYYTMAEAATTAADLKAADVYAYGELTKETAGADAAFRYIGELSKNKETWDATDVSKINIAYTIQGLPQSIYDTAAAETGADGIVYGLYKEKLSAVYSEISGAYWISIDRDTGFAAAPTSLTIGGTAKTAGTDYTFEKSGWIKLTAKPTAGDEIVLVVNGTIYKATVPTAATP